MAVPLLAALLRSPSLREVVPRDVPMGSMQM